LLLVHSPREWAGGGQQKWIGSQGSLSQTPQCVGTFTKQVVNETDPNRHQRPPKTLGKNVHHRGFLVTLLPPKDRDDHARQPRICRSLRGPDPRYAGPKRTPLEHHRWTRRVLRLFGPKGPVRGCAGRMNPGGIRWRDTMQFLRCDPGRFGRGRTILRSCSISEFCFFPCRSTGGTLAQGMTSRGPRGRASSPP
jgi:hypothetical protein